MDLIGMVGRAVEAERQLRRSERNAGYSATCPDCGQTFTTVNSAEAHTFQGECAGSSHKPDPPCIKAAHDHE